LPLRRNLRSTRMNYALDWLRCEML
jgi:hypothetical protein